MKFRIMPDPAAAAGEAKKTDGILRAAKRLFIRGGSAAFSVRGVAKEARLSQGAVQHFYKTKHMLLAATLEYVVNQYESAYWKLFQKLPETGEARLLAVIDLLVSDIWKRETRQFFFELWALSSHEPIAADLVGEIYAFHVERLGTFIAAASPALPAPARHRLAVQIAAMIEGLMLFSGGGRKSSVSRTEMIAMVKRSVLDLIAASHPSTQRNPP